MAFEGSSHNLLAILELLFPLRTMLLYVLPSYLANTRLVQLNIIQLKDEWRGHLLKVFQIYICFITWYVLQRHHEIRFSKIVLVFLLRKYSIEIIFNS